MAHWHDFNPWAAELIYVPDADEFLDALYYDGSRLFYERMFEQGQRLDCYILPRPSGFHSMGIRYGKEDADYYSLYGDRKKLQALINKYQGVQL